MCRHRGSPIWLGLLLGWALCACAPPSQRATPTWRLPEAPSYVDRRRSYLEHCARGSAPGNGAAIHGQVCRAALGLSLDTAVIEASLEKVEARRDTADFDLTSLLRILLLDRSVQAQPRDVTTPILEAVLGFKYGYDEPGPDEMVFWSENHRILFAALAYLAGSAFPDHRFRNSGRSGRRLAEAARPRVETWLEERARWGFSEFHSNVYYNEDIPALVNLVDFAPDPSIRARAAIVLDQLLLDIGLHSHRGLFATAHGRTYPNKLVGGLRDSTAEAAWIAFGRGPYTTVTEAAVDNFSGAFLATSSEYGPPPPLLAAVEAATACALYSRHGLDLVDGPRFGRGFSTWDEIIFWWGATGFLAPEVIDGTLRLVDNFDLWDGYAWRDVRFLDLFVDTSVPRKLSETFATFTRGIVLEAADTYTWRTPRYQLSGLVGYKPGAWTAQVHAWQATIDRDAYVFTSWPGGSEGDYMGTDWTGGFLPHAAFRRGVGLIIYRLPKLPPVAEGLLEVVSNGPYGFRLRHETHAYVPKAAFDRVTETAGWVLAERDGVYLALWSARPASWRNDHELVAPGDENAWVVELVDGDEVGSFETFVERIAAAPIAYVAGELIYESPFEGRHRLSYGQPLVHADPPRPRPYPRWSGCGVSITDGWQGRIASEAGTYRWDFGTSLRSLEASMAGR